MTRNEKFATLGLSNPRLPSITAVTGLDQKSTARKPKSKRVLSKRISGKTAVHTGVDTKLQREITVTHLKLAKPELVGSLLPETPRKRSNIVRFSTEIERYLISSPTSHIPASQSLISEAFSSKISEPSGVEVLNSILCENALPTDIGTVGVDIPGEDSMIEQHPQQNSPSHALLQAKLVPSDLHAMFTKSENENLSYRKTRLASLDMYTSKGRVPDPILNPEDLSEHAIGVSNSMLLPLPANGDTHSYSSSIISKQDVLVLEAWMGTMLRRVQEEVTDVEQRYDDIQRIYYIVFYELMRQVMVQNYERGQLLHHVWVGHMMVYEHRLETIRHQSRKIRSALEEAHLERESSVKGATEVAQEREEEEKKEEKSKPIVRNGKEPGHEERQEEYQADTNESHSSEVDGEDWTEKPRRRKSSVFDNDKLRKIHDMIASEQVEDDGWFKPKTPDPAEYESPRNNDSYMVNVLSNDLDEAHDRIDSLELELDELREKLMKMNQPEMKEVEVQTESVIDAMVEEQVKLRLEDALKKAGTTSEIYQDDLDPALRRRWKKCNTKISNSRMLFDMNVPVFPEKWVIKQVNKILLDRISPIFENVVQSVEHFVFDFFIRKYGLPSVAKQNIAVLARNVFQYQTNPLISIFLKVSRGQISEESFQIMLSALKLCTRPGSVQEIPLFHDKKTQPEEKSSSKRLSLAKVSKSLKKRSGASLSLSTVVSQAYAPVKIRRGYEMSTELNVIFPEDEEGNQNWVSMRRAEEVLERIFPRMGEVVRKSIMEKLSRYSCQGLLEEWKSIKGSRLALFEKTERVDRDVFLGMLIQAKLDQEHRQNEFFEKAFRDGDDNGDGVLELFEFEAILKHIDPDISLAEVTRMFSDAISHPSNFGGSEDAMTPKAFSVTCSDRQLARFLVEQDDGTFILARLAGNKTEE